jgi:hypothetical protein
MSKRLKFFSLTLIILGLLLGGTWRGVCLGDKLFVFFGISPWSNGTTGTHYVAMLALVPLLSGIALFRLSQKYVRQDKTDAS